MHGTPGRTELAATRRRSIKAGVKAMIKPRTITLAVLAGFVAGGLLAYAMLGDDLLVLLGLADPKDCG